LIFLGVAGSSFFKIEKQVSLKPGESLEAGRYTLKYTGIKNSEDAHIASQAAEVEVSSDGQYLTTMHPEKRLYKRQNQPTTEVAIRPTLRDDLYVVMGSYDEPSGLVTLQVFVNPLLSWLWIGGLTLVLGTCVVMAPNPAERRAVALARAQTEISSEVVAD
jgi:cytochrome c-type biogenesis protein CcmF